MRGKTIPLFAGTDLSTAFSEVETVITIVTQVAVLTSPALVSQSQMFGTNGALSSMISDFIYPGQASAENEDSKIFYELFSKCIQHNEALLYVGNC